MGSDAEACGEAEHWPQRPSWRAEFMGFPGWSLQGKRAWGGAPIRVLPDLPLLPLPPVRGEYYSSPFTLRFALPSYN